MKTLIIPDLHEPQQPGLDAIESLISKQAPGQVVFLGDYFDSWHDTPADARRTGEWLAESLKDPRRVHLTGNHDASYFWAHEPTSSRPGPTFCPGFTWEKEAEIRAVLGPGAEANFVFHTWVDGWLLTHAGLSARWVPEGVQVKGWLEAEETNARQAFANGRMHWFVVVGSVRGGDRGSGGILWCDHRELLAVPGLKQLYGHTPAKVVRVTPNVVCIDTNSGDGMGPRHFAIIEDKNVSVHLMQP